MSTYTERRKRGVCVDCAGRVQSFGRSRCDKHQKAVLRRSRVYRSKNPSYYIYANKKLRDSRRAAGLCIRCTSQAIEGKSYCETHQKMTTKETTRYIHKLSEKEFRKLKSVKRCSMCGGQFNGSGHEALAAVIDHNHVTGKIRGVLHQRCNLALGRFHDNIEELQAAINYLKRTDKKP